MVTIYQREKRQRILIIVFLLVVLTTLLVLYFGREKPLPTIPVEEIPTKKVEIDFGVLENPILKELEFYEKVESAKPENIGKSNPFIEF
jgi:hypothetical protein